MKKSEMIKQIAMVLDHNFSDNYPKSQKQFFDVAKMVLDEIEQTGGMEPTARWMTKKDDDYDGSGGLTNDWNKE
jgi:hypothetical protein